MLPGITPALFGGTAKLGGDALLHFDGANNSTVITDSAAPSRVWTCNSPALLTTSVYKFAPTSFYTGASGWVDTPADPSLDLGSSDFTIDCWLNPGGSGTRYVAGQNDSAGAALSWNMIINGSKNLRFTASADGVASTVSMTSTSTTGVGFTHFAATRAGANWYLFFNGGNMQTASFAGSIFKSPNKIAIGRRGESTASQLASSYIDEFRMHIGSALWTAPFTPPTAPYP